MDDENDLLAQLDQVIEEIRESPDNLRESPVRCSEIFLRKGPLHSLCQRGCPEDQFSEFKKRLFILTKYGIDIDLKNESERTSLHEACEAGHSKIVDTLLDAGAKLLYKGGEGDIQPVVDQFGWTPLQSATLENHQEIVQRLIGEVRSYLQASGFSEERMTEELKKYVDHRNTSDMTALQCAYKQKHFKLIGVLVEAGAEINLPVDPEKNSLLHDAIKQELGLAAITPLVAHGADVNESNSRGETAIYLAAERNQSAVFPILIQSAGNSFQAETLDKETRNKKTPLSIAIEKHHWQCVRALLKLHEDLERVGRRVTLKVDHLLPGHEKSTLLHKVVKNEELSDITQMLVKAGAKTHAEDSEGWTPVHYACKKGNLKTIKALCQSCDKEDFLIALSFSILFFHHNEFHFLYNGFVTTTVMMAGELGYSGVLFFNNETNFDHGNDEQPRVPDMNWGGVEYYVTTQVIFVLFVTFVTVVMMNLLIGLAVDDIEKLRKEGRQNRLKRLTLTLDYCESDLLVGRLRKYFREQCSIFHGRNWTEEAPQPENDMELGLLHRQQSRYPPTDWRRSFKDLKKGTRRRAEQRARDIMLKDENNDDSDFISTASLSEIAGSSKEFDDSFTQEILSGIQNHLNSHLAEHRDDVRKLLEEHQKCIKELQNKNQSQQRQISSAQVHHKEQIEQLADEQDQLKEHVQTMSQKFTLAQDYQKDQVQTMSQHLKDQVQSMSQDIKTTQEQHKNQIKEIADAQDYLKREVNAMAQQMSVVQTNLTEVLARLNSLSKEDNASSSR
ncbi:unnamed protein product [Cyprideis torosa]|uniref:Ion transport domain-containing protein n=1 Tax=Cyprideis torosa TaxID=163714 RepID=A0A7R8ZMS8_9CRUS|nr:unnamed protein product [Cyprideis torosa]CAG0886271.1 unnamed protein product [Cyprideis torosa]